MTSAQDAPTGPPDLVLRCGRILTVDAGFSEAEAVAIRGDRIQAVGSSERVTALAGPATAVVDLDGATVVPGLHDSHYHFLNRAARAFHGIRLDQFTSVPQILCAVAEKATELGPGEMVFSNGGNAAELLDEGRTPTLAELDRVSPDNPVLLTFEDGKHVNSAMLRLSGITSATRCPPGGRIGRHPETGELTGVFAGTASRLLAGQDTTVTGDSCKFTTEQLLEGVRWGQRLLAENGVTSIRNPALRPEEMAAYHRLWAQGELTVRVAMDLTVDHVNLTPAEVLDQLAAWGVRQPFGDPWLRINGVSELWIDQSTDGMLISWPYRELPPVSEGRPGYQGIQRLPLHTLTELLLGMARLGWRPLVHAGGDTAVDVALDAFEAVDREVPLCGRRWVLDHAHYGRPRHLARVKRLGLVVAMQYHPYTYYPIFAAYHGADQAADVFPVREWLDAGIVVAGGSDLSRVPTNPFEGIAFWVTRRTRKWGVTGPRHAITRQEALRMITADAAYLTFEEDLKGSIEPGKLADLAILSRDYLRVPDDELASLTVDATLVGGRVAHRSAPCGLDLPTSGSRE